MNSPPRDNARPPTIFRTILVAFDFDETSTHALELGVDLAKQFGSSLALVHVWDVPPYPYTSMGSGALHRAVETAAREAFDAVIADTKARATAVTGVLRRGTAWREILAAAEMTRPDLLIVGTHGRRGLPRALLGSVAEKIVRLSFAPVMAVPPHP